MSARKDPMSSRPFIPAKIDIHSGVDIGSRPASQRGIDDCLSVGFDQRIGIMARSPCSAQKRDAGKQTEECTAVQVTRPGDCDGPDSAWSSRGEGFCPGKAARGGASGTCRSFGG